MSKLPLHSREWHKNTTNGSFLISTNPTLLNHAFINTAFASADMPWATSMAPDHLALMLSQSVTLGLYSITPAAPPAATTSEPSSPRTPSPTLDAPHKEQITQVGLARFITDHVTFAYLTDVYVSPTYRGSGLARWLIACAKEIIHDHPALRRAMLLTGTPALVSFYAKDLNFRDANDGQEKSLFVMMSKKATPLD